MQNWRIEKSLYPSWLNEWALKPISTFPVTKVSKYLIFMLVSTVFQREVSTIIQILHDFKHQNWFYRFTYANWVSLDKWVDLYVTVRAHCYALKIDRNNNTYIQSILLMANSWHYILKMKPARKTNKQSCAFNLRLTM